MSNKFIENACIISAFAFAMVLVGMMIYTMVSCSKDSHVVNPKLKEIDAFCQREDVREMIEENRSHYKDSTMTFFGIPLKNKERFLFGLTEQCNFDIPSKIFVDAQGIYRGRLLNVYYGGSDRDGTIRYGRVEIPNIKKEDIKHCCEEVSKTISTYYHYSLSDIKLKQGINELPHSVWANDYGLVVLYVEKYRKEYLIHVVFINSKAYPLPEVSLPCS